MYSWPRDQGPNTEKIWVELGKIKAVYDTDEVWDDSKIIKLKDNDDIEIKVIKVSVDTKVKYKMMGGR